MSLGGQMPTDTNGELFSTEAIPEGVVASNDMRPPISDPTYNGLGPQAL